MFKKLLSKFFKFIVVEWIGLRSVMLFGVWFFYYIKKCEIYFWLVLNFLKLLRLNIMKFNVIMIW